jgi:hypothetical protein
VVSSNGSNPDAYLSSFTIHETDFDPSVEQETIGAYPVHMPDLQVAGYRPTNDSCLMRDMLHPWFCPVCQENNWRELLGRIKLVDNYEVKADPLDPGFDVVRLEVVPLGQFRSLGESRWGAEAITIKWRLGSQEIVEAADKTEVRVPVTSRSLPLQAEVAFVTPEIRLDETGYANQKIVIARPRSRALLGRP